MPEDDQTHPVINVEETVGKTVGRVPARSAAEQSRRVQEAGAEIYRTRRFRVCRPGVYRFESHEEADEWMRQWEIERAMKEQPEKS